MILQIGKKQNLIISTGGGVVLKKENVDALKQNGKLFFLDRDLDKLQFTASRPLSSDKQKLTDLFNKRYLYYLNACDILVDANGDVQDVVNKILGGK